MDINPWSLVETVNWSPLASLSLERSSKIWQRGDSASWALTSPLTNPVVLNLAFSLSELQIPACDSKLPCRIVIFKLCAYKDHFHNIHNYIDHHTIIDLPSFSINKNNIYLYYVYIYSYLYTNIIRTSTTWICNAVITIISQNSKITSIYVCEIEFIQSIKSSELCLIGHIYGKHSANYTLDIISVYY